MVHVDVMTYLLGFSEFGSTTHSLPTPALVRAVRSANPRPFRRAPNKTVWDVSTVASRVDPSQNSAGPFASCTHEPLVLKFKDWIQKPPPTILCTFSSTIAFSRVDVVSPPGGVLHRSSNVGVLT